MPLISENFKRNLKQKLQLLYYGDSPKAFRFRLGLLIFDFVVIIFFVVSSMLEPNRFIYSFDFFIALVIVADATARASFEKNRLKLFLNIDTWVDVVVIFSLIASMFIDNLSFLRVIRTLRLLRSYHLMRDLRREWPWFALRYDIIRSSFNLFAFVFFIAACVYVVEHKVNPNINHYLDALYFTVTTLTTTGFGDITMSDTKGRILAIIIMVVGVSLFLRLVQTIFRPTKVLFPCPDCGLQRHDPDAVHCKHCGKVLNIIQEGY